MFRVLQQLRCELAEMLVESATVDVIEGVVVRVVEGVMNVGELVRTVVFRHRGQARGYCLKAWRGVRMERLRTCSVSECSPVGDTAEDFTDATVRLVGGGEAVAPDDDPPRLGAF